MPEQNPQTQPRSLLSRRDLQHLREVIDERVREHGTAADSPLTCAEVRLLIDQAAAAADAGSAPAAPALSLTAGQLDELERLLTQATPGPWGRYGVPYKGALEAATGVNIGSVQHTEPIARFSGYMMPAEAHADLCIAAVNALPALVATARAAAGAAAPTPTTAPATEAEAGKGEGR